MKNRESNYIVLRLKTIIRYPCRCAEIIFEHLRKRENQIQNAYGYKLFSKVKK